MADFCEAGRVMTWVMVLGAALATWLCLRAPWDKVERRVMPELEPERDDVLRFTPRGGGRWS